MPDDQPHQVEIPAPEPPAPICRGCGCTLIPGARPCHSLGRKGWLCLDCWREPRNYWMHEYWLRDNPKG